jgi:hypothetical protein
MGTTALYVDARTQQVWFITFGITGEMKMKEELRRDLRDVGDSGELLEAGVTISDDYAGIFFDGSGLCGMEAGVNEVVLFEFYEGQPRLLVWADINREDPTHVIDLSGAMEPARNSQANAE